MPHHGMVWYGKSNSLPIPFPYNTIPKRFGMVWEIGKFPKRHFGITCYSQPLPKVSVFPNLICNIKFKLYITNKYRLTRGRGNFTGVKATHLYSIFYRSCLL